MPIRLTQLCLKCFQTTTSEEKESVDGEFKLRSSKEYREKKVYIVR